MVNVATAKNNQAQSGLDHTTAMLEIRVHYFHIRTSS